MCLRNNVHQVRSLSKDWKPMKQII